MEKRPFQVAATASRRLWDLDSGKELLALAAQKDGYGLGRRLHGRWQTGGYRRRQCVLRCSSEGGFAPTLGPEHGRKFANSRGTRKDIRHVAISPDGKQLLSGSFDGTMRLWDLQTGKEIKVFKGTGHFVESVAFTSDGKRAVCSYGPTKVLEARFDEDPRCSVRLWDLNTGKELKVFKGHAGPVLSLALSQNGRFLVSGSADNTMRLWEMPK